MKQNTNPAAPVKADIPCPGPGKWTRPEAGVIKINCDASISADGSAGIGFVVRDDRGAFMLAGHKGVQNSEDIEMVEAESVHWGLIRARERGFRRVHVESDCLSVITKLSRGYNGLGALRNLIDDIHMLARGFADVQWSHVKRGGNQVAHAMANVRPINETLYFAESLLPQSAFVRLSGDIE